MGRSPCCEKAHTNKGAWTKEEDDRLVAYIREHGEGCWRSLPKAAGLLRCGKSCRLRWINYLRPDLKRQLLPRRGRAHRQAPQPPGQQMVSHRQEFAGKNG
uniref:Uncharacterized protein n=1 Tax=Ananas comosus var. bracteatus TaxID=296719 RepID=A0A6V7NK43_ANACO|nr:unnamed protein product [Ananas comosus var. bracteatus]